ncbi:helix-turn-helix domain-containing protein [Kosakonia oryzae]|uniref:AraC family transcriptional regulator, mar-sox-rob regulon activator/AraC family of transcriptional regulator, multidrug resistance transcriptional activator n=1 Tax=Kosakonia oryzae TaxID=497725 RepID=A0AA94H3Z3_9ENTR|nr:helix-turn-helix domain-containing protein [Kosakonia oryzae]ANI82349.1 helix-turn-helix domain-containing protein [Kosakonia oryzae]UDJ84272.1 helix-turn-helix domain-containing protein [Kosakonia oryzae]SFC55343.1 AraC family transcriptional regulator, mar-sox-rob regulon activator/AraC family of transcriptional regulator, multidrug resistance transcriptional activator [Kosakonia oryzae]
MNHRKELIINVIAWINRNIQSPMKIDDVAARSGYSKWHLQRLFFAETGQNLGQFIRERKLSLIAEQLITSNESLINLAMKYGFDSQQSLTRAFHKKYQLPPHKYRKTFFRQPFDDLHTDVKPRK